VTLQFGECKNSLVLDFQRQNYYRYLHETLGMNYMPLTLVDEVMPIQNHIVWQQPKNQPEVIFFNLDSETDFEKAEVTELFSKITSAMNLSLETVWFLDSHGRSLMDFLNWLKNQKIVAPIVVMKQEPDIQNFIQNAGRFNWVECFSLSSMLKKNSLKKPTWEVLKLLLNKP
jgi:hypothetical protein